jgi:hypothetical protein
MRSPVKLEFIVLVRSSRTDLSNMKQDDDDMAASKKSSRDSLLLHIIRIDPFPNRTQQNLRIV